MVQLKLFEVAKNDGAEARARACSTDDEQLKPSSPSIFESNFEAKTLDLHTMESGNLSNEGREFEIRWRQMKILSGGPKLPRFITNSAAYRRLVRTNCSDEQIKSVDGMEQGTSKCTKSRPILNNISGSVSSGQLTAILGPSGVGKTTLLNSLTGNLNNLNGSGKVSLIGGQPGKHLSVAIVPQADVLPTRLTAMEDLLFTSRLKNPFQDFNHEQNIKKVVKHLKMKNFLNTRIGKLSGGETRRLSIGRELLGSPNVLILDEPTSSLDASTCKKVISALRNIVEHSESYLGHSMSIIVTIHQPQREVFNLFHRCYVMAHGGRAIYEGSPANILPHLLAHSSQLCDASNLNENPAVVAIEIASGEYGPDMINQLAVYHESHLAGTENDHKQSKPATNTEKEKVQVDERLKQCRANAGQFVSQTLTLIERSWILVHRNKSLLAIHIVCYLLLGFGTAAVFKGAIDPDEHACPVFRSEVDNVKDYFKPLRDRIENLLEVKTQANNNLTLFYLLVLMVATVAVAIGASNFPQQMQMFIREHRNGWYSPASFLASQTLVELPVDMIGPVLVVLTSYSTCNQPESMYHWRQICFLLVLLITTLIGKAQAQMVGALFMDSVQMSVFASCVLVAPFFLLSGLVICLRNMMWPFAYISRGSYLKYTFESFAMIRYGYGMCPCDESTIYGYPIEMEPNVLPKHLNKLAQYVLSYYQTTPSMMNTTTTVASNIEIEQEPNVILKMLRLMTDASNMFIPEPEHLGDCSKYRSLIMLDRGIEDGVLPEWIIIMIVILLIFKLSTYFMIKFAIRLRK